MVSKVIQFLFRNHRNINGAPIIPNQVNLEYWQRSINIGDALAPVISEWMLAKHNLQPDTKVGKASHLLTVGSIIAERKYPCDATVWGTGVHCFASVRKLACFKPFRKLDIRAVRGPVTKHILECCGYKCPDIFGDPGILMPMIYSSNSTVMPKRTVLVRHFLSADLTVPCGVYRLDTRTGDYKAFIDVLCSAEKVISSSLHGIILAESYGIPTVFLQENMSKELIKFYDWYYSTGRTNIKIAYSVEEAMDMEPMALPDLATMQEKLMNVFPYDLWQE